MSEEKEVNVRDGLFYQQKNGYDLIGTGPQCLVRPSPNRSQPEKARPKQKKGGPNRGKQQSKPKKR